MLAAVRSRQVTWRLVVALAASAPLAPAAQAADPGPLARFATPPLVLPGDAGAARSVGAAWIVGARPGAPAARIAARFGARAALGDAGIYRVARARARSFAAALRRAGRLRFAEPDVRARRFAYPVDPLSHLQYWVPAVVDTSTVTPPAVTASSPLLAVLDSQPDVAHPDFQGMATTGGGPVIDEHGTAVAATAGAPANGAGIVGIWPGMRIVVVPNDLSCASAVEAIGRALELRAAVLNMSYGFDARGCFAHLAATQLAFARGAVVVASGGNDFQEGNIARRPAVDPHVVTVAAVDANRESAFFSNENRAIDISAPGVDVLTAVPTAFDADGQADGWAALSGTSFSAPIVAGAAAWLRQARPALGNDQVSQVLRLSATDLGREGWDERFGFGQLDIGAALAIAAPRADPREPNDDVEWVDGSHIPQAKPIFAARDRRRTLRARLDQLEDPADVYRVTVPRRSRLRIRANPRFGHIGLEAYRAGADTIYGPAGLIDSVNRSGEATETLTLVNRSRSARRIVVDVFVDQGSRLLDADYTLELRRLSLR